MILIKTRKQGRKNKMATIFKLERKHRSLHEELRGKIASPECLIADHRRTTLRSHKWSYEMNKELNKMYINSKPSVYGYTKRLAEIWDEKHSDQNLEARHLAEQVRNIKKRQLLSQSDIEQITT